MVFGLSIQNSGLLMGVLAVIFGILVIKYPKIITNLIGSYLIITGLLTVLAVL
jgi:uncharacterized membrane protein HdeD (DUF308 family)